MSVALVRLTTLANTYPWRTRITRENKDTPEGDYCESLTWEAVIIGAG